jgi:hypothetical protein
LAGARAPVGLLGETARASPARAVFVLPADLRVPDDFFFTRT